MRVICWTITCFIVIEQVKMCLAGINENKPNKVNSPTCKSTSWLKFDPVQKPKQRRNGLEVCSKYKRNTCCNSTHATALRLKIREPVVAKFNPICQKFTEDMVCSACHPFIGTGQMKTVCPRLCNDWYAACKNEFYAANGGGTLTPCYGNALICSRLNKIVGSGHDFCEKMGYEVATEDDTEGYDCFDTSVPIVDGEMEPVVPWDTRLFKLFEDQSKDPSGFFIAIIFVPLIAIYWANRYYKQTQNSSYERSRKLEDARRKYWQSQQQSYTSINGSVPANFDTDSEEDSESDSDTNDDDVSLPKSAIKDLTEKNATTLE